MLIILDIFTLLPLWIEFYFWIQRNFLNLLSLIYGVTIHFDVCVIFLALLRRLMVHLYFTRLDDVQSFEKNVGIWPHKSKTKGDVFYDSSEICVSATAEIIQIEDSK